MTAILPPSGGGLRVRFGVGDVSCPITPALAVPAITVTAIFTFVNAWNEFVLALTLLRSSENYTLPLQVFAQVAGRYQIEWHHVMAASLLATVPVAVVFSWLQRFLIRGMSAGAVK